LVAYNYTHDCISSPRGAQGILLRKPFIERQSFSINDKKG